MTKTIGAIASVIGVIVVFIVCFRMVLGIAEQGHDPGAYFMLGGLCLLLVFGVVIFFVAMAKERSGYWDPPQPPAQPRPMIELTKHGDTWR
jgi:Na+/melibiose symporter-like transporter